jgi:hypothetical protein
VLCICYDAALQRSFLLVLQVAYPGRRTPPQVWFRVTCVVQATTMTEVARAYAPVTIPLGLHSLYADVATSSLA